jgi:hypothetical protein
MQLIDPFDDRRFELRVFPTEDVLFADAVTEAVRAIARDGGRDVINDRLEVELQMRYPAVVVKPVDRLAQLDGSQTSAWYVYRDGAPVP